LSVTPGDPLEADAGVDTAGLDEDTPPEDDAEDDPTAPVTAVDLTGRVYGITLANLDVVEPPGVGALLAQEVDRDLLVYVAEETAASLTFAVALAAANGAQDPCETVRTFPVADWSDNPYFVAGPGVLEASFGGSPASFRDLELTGTFDADGGAWREGTLSAELDTRELAPALGGLGDLCELLADLGGTCEPCGDGADACFTLRVEDVVATQRSTSFDIDPSCAG
jgi:hypothetical protein